MYEEKNVFIASYNVRRKKHDVIASYKLINVSYNKRSNVQTFERTNIQTYKRTNSS